MTEVENRGIMGKCPHCGYDLVNITAEAHQMRPFTILAGKYMVGKVIGEGGFGISYIGYDLNLELIVAIKEFYPTGFVTRESNVTTMVSMYTGKNEADVNKWRDGFINEARSLARFSNLNGIVEVRDFFNENGTAYIVMEYIDGITLKQYLKQNGGKIPADKVFQMMEPVMKSLSKVHDAGIVHRDISPDNIMITKYGGMKLLDFGAARDFAGNAEKSLSIMLKPGYAPEEQYRSRGKQGPWSDVYALAATIYKCITGITPVESMERLRNDTLKSPKELGMNITDAQNAAIKIGMAVYAEQRFQNMDAFYRALYSRNNGSVVEPAPAQVPPMPAPPVYAPIKQAASGDSMPLAGSGGLSKNAIVIIGAGAVCCLLLIITIIAIIPKGSSKDTYTPTVNNDDSNDGDNGNDRDNGDSNDDSAGTPDIDEINSMIDNGQYEAAINLIADNGMNEKDALQRAVDGLYEQCKNEADSLVQNFDIKQAISIIDARQQYFLDIAERTGYLENTHEGDLSQHRYDKVIEYRGRMFDDAQQYANDGKENEMLNTLNSVRENLSEYGYDFENEISEKTRLCYSGLIKTEHQAMVNRGENFQYIKDYLENNRELAGNDAQIIDLLNYYSNALGKLVMVTTPIRTNASGYILPSDYRLLTDADLQQLSAYEVYAALYEIYARHGRNFDNEKWLEDYFRSRRWYKFEVTRENFDERVLSDIERANVSCILDYQLRTGQREW